jgi:hypothetical protein
MKEIPVELSRFSNGPGSIHGPRHGRLTAFLNWRKENYGKTWRRGSESNRRIKVLQTSPLPLGYRAIYTFVV